MRLRCLCLVIHGAHDLQLAEQDAGEMGPGQVLVKVGYGGICGSDLHYFHDGGFGTVRLKEPMILGHEVAGIVAAVAPDVTALKIGDRVAVNPSRPCGACKFCLEGLPHAIVFEVAQRGDNFERLRAVALSHIVANASVRSPTAWRILGASACGLKNSKLLGLALEHLDPGSRDFVRAACDKVGFQLRY